MKCNVGKTEGTLRMLAGAGIISLGLMKNSWLGAIGIIPIITGFTGYCPLSQMFGISTCKNQQDNIMNSVTGVNNVSELLHLPGSTESINSERSKSYAASSR